MKFNSLNSTYLSDLRLDAEALERKLDYIEHMIYFMILRRIHGRMLSQINFLFGYNFHCESTRLYFILAGC